MIDIARDAIAPDRLEPLRLLAATPGSEHYLDPDAVDIEAWNHIGDPLCEDLLTLMRERRLMGGDIFANARKLEADGEPAAVAFFADVEAIPEWADFEAMRQGAAMGRRNPIGMLFGMHGGLPFTYTDPATAAVMESTGRLGQRGDYRRRFWETATGFIGALDVDEMRPGGREWEKWVRIRFLHTMIRLGIRRSGRWELDSMPIGQDAKAAATHIFGPYRVNIIRYFGGRVTQAEEDSFALMWRWVSRLQGVNNQLLGRTHDEQFRIQTRLHQFLYGPSATSRELTAAVIDGAAATREYLLPRRLHAALVRQLLAADMVDTLRGRDVQGDLGLRRDPAAEFALRVVTGALWSVNQLARGSATRRLLERRGGQFIDYVVERGLDGVKAEYRGTPVAGVATDK